MESEAQFTRRILDVSDPAHPKEAGRWSMPGQKEGEPLRKILSFCYGLLAYVVFLGAFLYAIGFVTGLVVPKTVVDREMLCDQFSSGKILGSPCRHDTQSPAADELAIQAKIFGSETAVRVITDLMRVVGIDSYDHEAPLGRLLQDALAFPSFGGGNMGVRRRQLHNLLKRPDYDALLASATFESSGGR
jgi:hypothetical protein